MATNRLEPRREGGAIFRRVKYPPDPIRLTSIRLLDHYGNAMNRTGGAHLGMHKTDTIDYAVILSEVSYLILDEGEVLLKAGDCLVQRGTNHAWSNRTDKNCVVVFIMIEAVPVATGDHSTGNCTCRIAPTDMRDSFVASIGFIRSFLGGRQEETEVVQLAVSDSALAAGAYCFLLGFWFGYISETMNSHHRPLGQFRRQLELSPNRLDVAALHRQIHIRLLHDLRYYGRSMFSAVAISARALLAI
jgi:hypothetical protein